MIGRMDEREHLHDGEQLLLCMRPGVLALLRGCGRAVLEALAAGVVLSIAALLLFWLALDMLAPWPVFIAAFVLPLFGLWAYRWFLWRKASLRVTNDRILVEPPGTYLPAVERTIKWIQYQESDVEKPGILELLFGDRDLTIHFGSKDALSEVTFPSLRYAKDVKHYLDKVESSVRAKTVAELRAFVAKPRGKRY